MKRRSVFGWLAGAVAATLPRLSAFGARRAEPFAIHFVGADHRHVEATVLWHADGSAAVEYAVRPVLRVSFGEIETRQTVRLRQLREDSGPYPKRGTWHRAEGCPCGRAYSEWWYGRKPRRASVDPLPGERLGGGFQEKAEGHEPALVLCGRPEHERLLDSDRYRTDTMTALEEQVTWERRRDGKAIQERTLAHLEERLARLKAAEGQA